jgi:protein-tyrosine phosphatase
MHSAASSSSRRFVRVGADLSERAGPTPDSYWVIPGRFLAGSYPLPRLASIREAGIDFFLDLTVENEYSFPPYAAGVEYRRLAIRDFGCPTVDRMRETLDAIDDALARGRNVFVHCYAGVGRTGTVVGCFLVRHGMSPADALDAIAHWRAGREYGRRRSPETDEQEEFVLAWSEGE